MKDRSRRTLALMLLAALLGAAPLTTSADNIGMFGSGNRLIAEDGGYLGSGNRLLADGVIGSGTRSDGGGMIGSGT